MLPQIEPLTGADLERLDDLLCAANSDEAMTLEELDGFFCALICGPELVPPSEYLPEVFGGEMTLGSGVSTAEEAQELLNLLTRHWNNIAGTLLRGEVYVPLIIEDENGIPMGNDWAIGFVQGMHMRLSSWDRLVDDKEQWAALTPMMLLAHEGEPDSEFTDKPLTPETRFELLCHMANCVPIIYDFFRGRTPKPKGKKESKAKGGKKKPLAP